MTPGQPRARARRAPSAAETLERQIADLVASEPARRIDHREPILAHGVEAIGPLADLVDREPDLGPAVIAWLEVLARRDGAARVPVGAALRAFAGGPRDDTRRHAAEALVRLGLPATTARTRRGPAGA